MKNSIFFSLLCLVFCLTSCNDDFIIDDIFPETPTDLINDGWVLTSFIVEDADGAVETIDEMDACEVDNILIFDDEGSVKMDEGTTKCDPDAPQVEDGGLYTFIADEQTLLMFVDDELMTMEVLELTDSQLKLRVDESDDPTELSICTMTFKPAN